MKKITSRLYRWYWSERYQSWKLRLWRFGRSKATVWPNGVWSTYNKDGDIVENSKAQHAEYMRFENLHYTAKREAFESCVKFKLI